MEIYEPFSDLEKQISDMLERLNKQDLLSVTDCKQIVAGLERIKEYQATQSSKSKKEKMPTMDVKIDELIRSFHATADDSKQQLQCILTLISEGRVPSAPTMSQINATVDKLREQYMDVCQAAANSIPAEEMPQEDSPADAYVEAVKNSRFLEYRKRLEAMRTTLERFASVQSKVVMFVEALASYQSEARELIIQMDQAAPLDEKTVEEFQEKTAAPDAFLMALACPDYYSNDENWNLLNKVESYYSKKVRDGLSSRQYFLPGSAVALSFEKQVPEVPAEPESQTEYVSVSPKENCPIPLAQEATASVTEADSHAVTKLKNESAVVDEPDMERWHRLGIDDPREYLYTIADSQLTVEKSPKANSDFSSKKFESEIMRNGQYSHNTYALSTLQRTGYIDPAMLAATSCDHSTSYGSICETLLNQGYLTKFTVQGYPSFYAPSLRGRRIFSTLKSVKLLNLKKEKYDASPFLKNTAAAALTRVLFLHTFSIASELCKGQEIPIEERMFHMIHEDFFFNVIRLAENSRIFCFSGIVSNSIDAFESYYQFIFSDDTRKDTDVLLSKATALFLIGPNRQTAHAIAAYFYENLHEELNAIAVYYYDYETKTCYRSADDSVVELSALVANPVDTAGMAADNAVEENVIAPTAVCDAEEPAKESATPECTEEPVEEPTALESAEEPAEDPATSESAEVAPVLSAAKAAPADKTTDTDATITVEEILEETAGSEEVDEKIAELEETVEEVAEIDFQSHTAQENAELLLKQPEKIRLHQLVAMAVQLIAENRMAEAVSLAESVAGSPAFGAKITDFYHAFQQSVQQPGQDYRYSSDVINEQQRNLISEAETDVGRSLQLLHQVMILTNDLWAMAFPSVAYDHDLYNDAGMVITGELRDALFCEIPQLERLVKLLSTDLKDLSFQNDGLGFSSTVIGSLVNTDEREKRRLELCRQAATLKNVPTSMIRITGLETYLKQLVGPTSEIGHSLRLVAADHREKAGELREHLEKSLGLAHLEDTDNWLDEYIDAGWTDLYKKNSDVKVKHLENDSAAQRVCEKALTERLHVITDWLALVEKNQDSKFLEFKDRYARLRNQLKTALCDLKAVIDSDQRQDCYIAACQNILRLTADRMLNVLDGLTAESTRLFYLDLWKTPEPIVGVAGENLIISELYDLAGLEPWTFLLRGVATPAEKVEDILAQIDDYNSERWYKDFGLESLLCHAVGRQSVDRTESIREVQKDISNEIRDFESSIRMDRAYGRLKEHTMETVFSTLKVVEMVYQKTGNRAGFYRFIGLLRQMLDQIISRQTEKCRRRVQELEQQAEYADSPMLEVIHKALESGSLNIVDTYINYLQSGETELPISIKNKTEETNFLAQFQKCEKFYYNECEKHRGTALSNWGCTALERMNKVYQHWTSPNEKAAGLNWLKGWIQGKNSSSGKDRVKQLLSGLGFEVQNVVRGKAGIAGNECYEVTIKPVSTSLTDYPHPIYKFGTEISIPMNVVCLYGCQGVTTLISTMTNELHLTGSTIVLMDGTLTASDRQQMAERFKTSTSGQNSFLLIDRVLALYLASVDRGDRQNAMLRCTLPYTVEVLYGNGSGVVPEEMFIGRMMEMHDLRSDQGASLVYGGRQLGKTALLNRASRTLHAPEQKEYSFCVEVKDHGSQTLLERVNRQLQRLKLTQTDYGSLQELCQSLQEMWEDKKISMLRIFVDEVDCLFEEFRRNDYEDLRPFIRVRDNTKHKVKFVFAGTHNVAATDIAEKENNNLIHMGKPLCIKPLSNDDAMDLIRIPMAYLGFEIGEQQIELILSSTNSYPGLIHMFCSALIQSVCRDYDQCCTGESYPPYRISDAQMQTVFREQDIRKEIGQRVMATIRLNRKYKAVSYLLALMVYNDRNNGRSSLCAYGAKDLQDYSRKDYDLPLLQEMKEKDLSTLMDEMENMGILWKNRQTQKFRFRQQDFLEYIGDEDTLMEELLDESNWEDVS